MSLREEVELYSKITGKDGYNEPIVRIGAFLDGYEKGKENAEPHWIPVTERLPEPRIDVWCNSDLGQMVGYYDEMIETWFGRDYLELLVNAWMPLPEPFKGVTT